MKNKDIKKLTKDELNKKINLIKKDLFNIRFKKINGQLQDTAKISSLKTIVNISSEMGSISKNLNGGHYIYRTTKAALNAITKNMAIDLNKKYDINVFAIHPGRVKTKMNPEGLIDVNTCAFNILNLLSTNDVSINGKFIDLQKNEIPW